MWKLSRNGSELMRIGAPRGNLSQVLASTISGSLQSHRNFLGICRNFTDIYIVISDTSKMNQASFQTLHGFSKGDRSSIKKATDRPEALLGSQFQDKTYDLSPTTFNPPNQFFLITTHYRFETMFNENWQPFTNYNSDHAGEEKICQCSECECMHLVTIPSSVTCVTLVSTLLLNRLKKKGWRPGTLDGVSGRDFAYDNHEEMNI